MDLLEGLPDRLSAVELQIVQLRGEMREQFSAVREEFRTEIRTEVEAVRTDLRAEIRAWGDTIRTELRVEIREGDEETRRYMRVLHEEVLSRIATLQEGLLRRRKR